MLCFIQGGFVKDGEGKKKAAKKKGSSAALLGSSAPSTSPSDSFLSLPGSSTLSSSSRSSGCSNKNESRELSLSVPVMSPAQSLKTPSPVDLVESCRISGKSRQKKFHRHFKQAPEEESVLNCYSCALVGEILLQGHLYITKNYFAFYSNVFGYVTKLLIPTESVVNISKEKTAIIIPNAIGVETLEEKHVFSSLMSRDSTYKLMCQVWKARNIVKESISLIPPDKIETTPSPVGEDGNVDEDSSSSEQSSYPPTPTPRKSDSAEIPSDSEPADINLEEVNDLNSTLVKIMSLPKSTVFLIISSFLVFVLLIAAAFLLYRISVIQNQFVINPLLSESEDIYNQIRILQAQVYAKTSHEFKRILNTSLAQIVNVRQTMESLSLLLAEQENSQS